ncbi:hypothetical protein CLAFUW4_10405 [Fulvia fulva]|uniref:Stress-associated endoplasmic reticulum protein n=1 Tax=Passalora fulva TaxID=5499 RepID=A0A9Q8LE75_PASFU|nr:uncharacterized protein CLAFUR5_05020 [Fulvia fulva]KAK4615554.1 hypothetical protein CLAFUR4_10409 [Fulvia fulva]KAK4617310.1 hypothetical protein CLAFUR0_10410 [Fulvia fulva]UJO15754.1 hypothetical protein CLAFUR5_05020 [Fulvia fulva]WPV18940.1 hypothetical protein CLAFUW4_10405 [Fulvia fulva]WPV34220.1 hypothetical protein CLAFUW7_10405 [Fulvia fulva]
MAQTPQQRKANAAFAKKQEAKMGKPESSLPVKKEKKEKPPISPFWVYTLIFVVCGGLIFELLRMIAGYF